jgi:hypothetical protein
MRFDGGDSPVARAPGATPRAAALRLLMVLDDAHLFEGARRS